MMDYSGKIRAWLDRYSTVSGYADDGLTGRIDANSDIELDSGEPEAVIESAWKEILTDEDL